MKKLFLSLIVFSTMFVMSACSNNEVRVNKSSSNETLINEIPINEPSTADVDERKLQFIIDSYVETGTNVDAEEKPMFRLINAMDGVVFYMDNSPVKIYEFNSEADLKKALAEFKFTEWPTNGKFAIETKDEEAIRIFKQIK
ncbi:hypothetical protein [Paenibacillus endoradicis]|uniref:hypothetical protein n=1 Tax=Paenibacillus endoradicis TaxID=2972487 RepID=UPI002158FE96|nr:hypothetical protein [Paenibacillus endoradicis]MCR8656861.1 hypothetical protein [Paenibacillus endoradicis]